MIGDDASDPVLCRISRLPVLIPDDRRAAQLRARCRVRMQRSPTQRRVFGPALFTGLCVLYLSALALDVLRLRGML